VLDDAAWVESTSPRCSTPAARTQPSATEPPAMQPPAMPPVILCPLSKQEGLQPLSVHGDVELRDVTFAYPQRPGALSCPLYVYFVCMHASVLHGAVRMAAWLLPLLWQHMLQR
jgi:hypothetical protein